MSEPSDVHFRKGLVLRTLLVILQEAGRLKRADALAELEARVPLNSPELETVKSGGRRWDAIVAFGSSNEVKVGWLTKAKDGWNVTEAGVRAVEEFQEPGAFLTELDRLYRVYLDNRPPQPAAYDTLGYRVIEAALGLLEPGTWTTYTELAEISGIHAGAIGKFINNVPMDGGHRVLLIDGRPGADFRWATPRSETQQEVLEQEGLTFDAHGVADETRHVRAGDLGAILEESGVLQPMPRRGWLVRGSSVNGRDLVPKWLALGSVSLAATKLPRAEPGVNRDELKVLVDEGYSQASYAAKGAKVDEFHAFLSRMKEGDLVATASQGRLFIGRITGPASFVRSSDGRSNLRRNAEWLNPRGTDYGDLPSEVASRLQVQYDVVDLTRQLGLLDALVGTQSVEAQSEPTGEVALRDATQELADRLLVGEDWLQECIDLLRDRPQLIFYGPPGTGKTYLAQELAGFLAGDNVRLVQFHPAYSYEDFFEGYRPDESGGFSLRPGPMRKIVDQAKENPSSPYFLIIDEINRGNLAKVFGELYFLLEYGERQVDLLYASNDDVGFTLPKNVFIIGTMNTADRSIALVDAAMRRRFAFLPLHPSEPPTNGVLRQWLEQNGHGTHAADLLDALNERIDDADFKIGPSYLMRNAIYEPGGFERAWRTAILPQLEEHHYGDLDRADIEKRYGLAALEAQLTPASASEIPTDPQAEAHDDSTDPA